MASNRTPQSSIIIGHSEYRKSFSGLLDDMCRREGMRPYEVFGRWLECSTYALLNPVYTLIGDKQRWDANEDRYMQVVKSFRHPRATMDDMSRLLAFCALALQEDPRDFIGSMFMDIAANPGSGQFFTPVEVSALIARLSLEDAYDRLMRLYSTEGRTFLSLLEPAAGVGGMVLEANRVLREQNLNPATEVHWVCWDIDWRASCGCYIQLSLTNTSAVVVNGDTLRNEVFHHLPTMAAVRYPKQCT